MDGFLKLIIFCVIFYFFLTIFNPLDYMSSLYRFGGGFGDGLGRNFIEKFQNPNNLNSRFKRFYPYKPTQIIDNRIFDTPGGISNQLVASKSISFDDLQNGINELKLEVPPNKFLELMPVVYDYLGNNQNVNFDNILNDIRFNRAKDAAFLFVKELLEKIINKNTQEEGNKPITDDSKNNNLYCDVKDSCKVEMRDWRIYGIGSGDNTGYNILWDLQIVAGLTNKAVVHLFRVILWEHNGNFKLTRMIHEGDLPTTLLNNVDIVDKGTNQEGLNVKASEDLFGKNIRNMWASIGNIPLWNGPVDVSGNNGGFLYGSNEILKIVPDDAVITNLLKKQKEDALSDYKCYGKTAYNQLDCESGTDTYGKEAPKGTWDKACFYNFECPFYKSNKNYPNEFGGCVGGFCQMPVGVERKGVRYYEGVEKAVCRNCLEGDKFNNCCDKQKDRVKYPKLNSPDYAF
jgi:hypothetical protein